MKTRRFAYGDYRNNSSSKDAPDSVIEIDRPLPFPLCDQSFESAPSIRDGPSRRIPVPMIFGISPQPLHIWQNEKRSHSHFNGINPS
jgi:hypothetical protein